MSDLTEIARIFGSLNAPQTTWLNSLSPELKNVQLRMWAGLSVTPEQKSSLRSQPNQPSVSGALRNTGLLFGQLGPMIESMSDIGHVPVPTYPFGLLESVMNSSSLIGGQAASTSSGSGSSPFAGGLLWGGSGSGGSGSGSGSGGSGGSAGTVGDPGKGPITNAKPPAIRRSLLVPSISDRQSTIVSGPTGSTGGSRRSELGAGPYRKSTSILGGYRSVN